jgi:hypothetical protein
VIRIWCFSGFLDKSLLQADPQMQQENCTGAARAHCGDARPHFQY